MMPCVMYGAADAILCELLKERGKAVVSLYEEASDDPGWKCPYHPADFAVEPRLFQIGEDVVLAIRVSMPRPAEQLECRAVYLCQSKKSRQMLYFTSEMSAQGSHLLCAWTERQIHLNFGENEGVDEFERVLALFKEMILDGGLADVLHVAS